MYKGERGTSRKNLSNVVDPIPHHQNINMKFPQVQTILKFKNRYTKSIQNPIQVIQSSQIKNFPLKCFQHHNNFTLYCENDRKPLCASCMYQNNNHRTHKVIALDNSEEYLQKDCEKYGKLLLGVVDQINDLTKYMNGRIESMEKSFPQLLFRIQNQYKKLHELIAEKEKQHVNQVRYYKQKLAYEHGVLSTQLNRIVIYIDEKLRQFSQQQSESLLTKRNVLQILASSISLIQDDLILKKQKPTNMTLNVNFNVFRDIEDLLIGKFSNLKCFDSPEKKKGKDKTPIKSLITSTRNLQPLNEKSTHSPVSQKIKSSPSKQNLTNKKKSAIKNTKQRQRTPVKITSPRKKKEIQKSFDKKTERKRSKSTSNLKPQSPKRK